jgi:hypothetical protein
LSQEALIAEADELCAESAKELTNASAKSARLKARSLSRGTLDDQITRLKIGEADTQLARAVTYLAVDLRELDPSTSLRADFDAYVESLFAVSESLSGAAAAVEVIDPASDAQALADYRQAAVHLARSEKLAGALGFQTCSAWGHAPGPERPRHKA